jgi:chromosome segregation ATPase
VHEENGQFRTAAIGGFHRQDVLDYIARSAEASNAKILSLQEQVDQLRQAGEDAAQELEALRAEHCAVVKERDDALAQAETNQSELECRQEELEALRREAAELRETVTRLQPEADAMEQLKRQLTDIELDARTRGEQIVQKANREAETTRRTMEQILEKARQNFDVTRTDVEATASHMVGEMERLIGMLNRMTTAFDENEQAIAALRIEEE